MKIVVVIMAGGKGERFWPKSRKKLPKQFLPLCGGPRTMISLTAERAMKFALPEDIFVVSNASYRDLVRQNLPFLPEGNIINEPEAKNTAPCIAVAAAVIAEKYGDAVMAVLPSDHLIKDDEKFASTLKKAAAAAETGDFLITLGVTPQYPETGYGYIKLNKSRQRDSLFPVERFVEKPDKATAEKYVSSGDFLWNSGMFVWRSSAILARFEKLMPEVYSGARKIACSFGKAEFDDILSCEFKKFPSQSIDYGIMEKAGGIFAIPCDFGWNDMGGWIAAGEVMPKDENGNSAAGEYVALNSSGCIISGGEKLITLMGVKDLIIVDSPDAILIAAKKDAQNIKSLIAEIKQKKSDKYL